MRRLISNLAVCSVLALGWPIVAAAGQASATTCALVEQANVAYTTDPVDLHQYYADLWRPDDGGKQHPGIVVAHGGGFVAGTRAKVTGEAQTLACAGFVVLNYDYRLTGIENDAYTDALAAVAYLRPIVGFAGIGAHGVSAGAFLATRLAVEGKVDAGSGISGGGPAEAKHVDLFSKPSYMAHSIDDPNRPISDSEAVNTAYNNLPAPGVPHHLDEIAGTAHGDVLWGQQPAVQQAVIDWFHTYVPLSGTPPPPPPTVTQVSPNSGTTPGGTAVTITGTDFTNVRTVSFGPLNAASFTVASATSITAVTPPRNASTVDVTVTTTIGTSPTSPSDQFMFTTPVPPSPPSVTAVSPPNGPTSGGTTVTITGSNFTDATVVWFGNLTATSFTVVSPTSITATSSSRAVGATVDVKVSSPYGMSATSSKDLFTFVAPPPPTVTAVSPASGTTAGGNTVIITGTNFTGVTVVRFANLAAASFTVTSTTTVTVITPPHGAATVVDITVVTSAGTSAKSPADRFTFYRV